LSQGAQADAFGLRVHGTLKTAHGHLLLVKRLAAGERRNILAPNAAVFRPQLPSTQIVTVVVFQRFLFDRFVPINESLHLGVIYYQIEVAVVVQVAIRRAIGKTGV
jgi:hypothetical protein